MELANFAILCVIAGTLLAALFGIIRTAKMLGPDPEGVEYGDD